MTTTSARTTAARRLADARRHDLARATALLGRPDGSWRLVATITSGLATMASLAHDLDVDAMHAAAQSWSARHVGYRRRGYAAEAAYAGVLAGLLRVWAEQIRCGDIGEDVEEWEVLPEIEPARVPELEPVPA